MEEEEAIMILDNQVEHLSVGSASTAQPLPLFRNCYLDDCRSGYGIKSALPRKVGLACDNSILA